MLFPIFCFIYNSGLHLISCFMISVLIVPYGGCDIKGLLQSVTQADYIKFTTQVLESSIADMVKQTKIRGHYITQQCTIFDLENFSLSSFTWKPGKR